MKDADDVEDHLWPTEDNIVRSIERAFPSPHPHTPLSQRRELQALTRDCAPRESAYRLALRS